MRSSAAVRNVALALGLAAMVAAVEYFFRHYVLFWMPTFGTLRVNDLLALALAYSLLVVTIGSIARIDWRAERLALGEALRELATRWTYIPWILGLILSLAVLSPVDRWLWGEVGLPMAVSAWRNPAILFAPAAALLTVAAALCVNGILVPIAEEYLWRGHVQARLQCVLPGAAAVGVTAALFSLKHALVDASWGRLLTLLAFGVICGVVARRHTWRGSAALHLFVNTLSTAVALAIGMD